MHGNAAFAVALAIIASACATPNRDSAVDRLSTLVGKDLYDWSSEDPNTWRLEAIEESTSGHRVARLESNASQVAVRYGGVEPNMTLRVDNQEDISRFLKRFRPRPGPITLKMDDSVDFFLDSTDPDS